MKTTLILIPGAILTGLCLIFLSVSYTQQIDIPRIEQMPNLPAPYELRDWKQVTIGYDEFVFDFNKTGLYLPLIWWQTNPINYPLHNSFGLHTVVGTRSPGSSEAINVLPAVISASLAGIDKSNQTGQNWVLMCEEYFNKTKGANVYLNHPDESNWDDWWYDVMPNVFFFQLYDLYPHTGDFDFQLTSVADRWLAAVQAMGGNTTPWQKPYMNYRAFNLMTMLPFTGTPTEPEAAGAIAWILYNAFSETGQDEYRIGAELAMEFLSNWNTNPSYELQLPYGAQVAARMNAELGTTYDISKLVNWCFTTTGNVRNWGAIVGTWGGYDCSGLIGEVSSNDYAFAMNTFEQAGALLPLVRYDERFARAIGKWMLNAVNASRLFYPNYLPDENQDSEAWAHQYDSTSVIGHEALHEYDPHNPSATPYATGDAVTGGWGYTTLTLYGSSHVGILGGIVDTTDVELILQLNTLKTDFFRDQAYPTYLYYNPFQIDTMVTITLPTGSFDLYDAIENSFLASNVTGNASFTIPADQAILLVLPPAGGTISYDLDRMLINGVVADYHSDQIVMNYPPRIKSITPVSNVVIIGDSTDVYCTAQDRDLDTLTYNWTTSSGVLKGNGNIFRWIAPGIAGNYTIQCIVIDSFGQSDTAQTNIEAVEYINHNPVINALKALPRKIDLGASSRISCSASDADNDSLTYSWSSLYGSLVDSASTAIWTAPATAGNYYITCRVQDSRGGDAVDSLAVEVRDFSAFQPGKLLAYYPFNGNANDLSGNEHNGTVYGAALTQDRLGNPNSAYLFNGLNDYIRIPNHDSLNVQQAISINFWMRIDQLYTREAFPISHGSWENRWKVSIIPEHKLRWTIKTTSSLNNGIIDLDTETILQANTWYNVTVYYDGSDFEVYLDGQLDNFGQWSGLIRTTTYDLTIGQMLPNNSSYNFKGALDDIRIYDYGLSVQEIENLASGSSRISDKKDISVVKEFELRPNYPNPFNASTTIQFDLPRASQVILRIFDVTGRKVITLINGKLSAGSHRINWNAADLASGIYYYRMQAGDFIKTRKMLLIR